ncbi:MAG: T9SS type A sorting domain-containing protein [Chitinophagaceae bacterium]
MKKIFLIFVLFPQYVFAQNNSKLKLQEQLIAINENWNGKSFGNNIDKLYTHDINEVNLIQLHLQLVEQSLRKNVPSNLSSKQLINRNNCLSLLHQYWTRGVFPKNTFHAKRTPYFIDIFGTYCAVGYLIKETGYEQLAQKIHKENNYGYIYELKNKYAEINTWAKEFGFTVDELAWIQPSYGGAYNTCNSSTYSTQFVTINASCPGVCDGSIILPSNNMYTLLPIVYGYISPAGLCGSLCSNTTYTVTAVDALGNTQATIINIGSNNQPATLTSKTNISCYGYCNGTVQFNSVFGGTQPYTYHLYGTNTSYISQLNNTFDSLCNDYYYGYVTDSNGCNSATSYFQISQPPNFEISIVQSNPILCYGDSATIQINAIGGTMPYMGIGFHIISSGNHYFTISDSNNCTIDTTINISSPSPILISTFGYADSGTNNGAAKCVALGGTPPYQYLWTNGSTSDSIANLPTGMYYVAITDSNFCQTEDSVFVPLVYPDQIENLSTLHMSIYPNPSHGTFSIQSNTKFPEATLEIVDIVGKKIYMQKGISNQIETIYFEAPLGIYILKIKVDGREYLQKIIKN